MEIESSKPKESKGNKLSYNEQREFNSLENEIVKLELERKELNKLLLEPNEDYDQLTTWGKRLEEVKTLIEEKEFRWLELSERV